MSDVVTLSSDLVVTIPKSAIERLATADAIVCATACRHDVPSVTCDAHFQGLPGVAFVLKRPPAP